MFILFLLSAKIHFFELACDISYLNLFDFIPGVKIEMSFVLIKHNKTTCLLARLNRVKI